MRKKPWILPVRCEKPSLTTTIYLESMNQMKKMGGISSILGMLPGLSE